MHNKLLSPRPSSSPSKYSPSNNETVKPLMTNIRNSIQSALISSYDSLVSVSNGLFHNRSHETQATIEQMQKLQQWTTKLEAARNRKFELSRVHSYQQEERNQRHEDVTSRIRQQRLEEQLQREELAFEELKKSQDYVLVNQVCL